MMRPSSSVDNDMNRQVVAFLNAHAVKEFCAGCDEAFEFGLSLDAVELKVVGVDIEVNLRA